MLARFTIFTTADAERSPEKRLPALRYTRSYRPAPTPAARGARAWLRLPRIPASGHRRAAQNRSPHNRVRGARPPLRAPARPGRPTPLGHRTRTALLPPAYPLAPAYRPK